MSRILIFGASGMIGHALWRALSLSSHDIFGTMYGRGDRFAHLHGLFQRNVSESFDAGDPQQVRSILQQVHPEVVVNCVGITKRKNEANDLAAMFQVNALFPHQVALWAKQNKARVIHFSTDCVFDGATGNYHERSVMTAPDLYGQSKYFGELDYDHCLTIRTSMIGREISGFSELLEWFLAQKGKRIRGFRNALYSGVTTNTMAPIIRRIIEHQPDLSGRYQVAGPVISKYDLLCQLRDAFGLDMTIEPDESFHCDRTLQSNKFTKATGIKMPAWSEMIANLVRDRDFYEVSAETH